MGKCVLVNWINNGGVTELGRLFSYLIILSMSFFVYKMVKKCFPKPKRTSSNVLFCPQPKNIQFTVREEERNQKMFTFKKLEEEN